MEIKNFTKGKYRILSFEGAYVYDQMHPLDGRPAGIHIRNEKGELNFSRFEGFMDFSLETEKLRNVYAKHRDELSEKFELKSPYRDTATLSVISLSFDEAHNKYHRMIGKEGFVYVHHGYAVDFSKDLVDHVCVREVNGEPKVIAIEISTENEDTKGMRIYTPVQQPINPAILPSFAVYDPRKGAYTWRVNPETLRPASMTSLKTRAKLREELYQNGFICDGVHYVRYKRSAGSSREGHCLFIAEPLYAEMIEWSSCGLDPDKAKDRAAWEAYTALTLSSIEAIVKIPKKAILLLPDAKSVFEEARVARVDLDLSKTLLLPGANGKSVGGMLEAKETACRISNTIWDGEALLDESVFAENGYADKGMMLLRNRFFKTCAFNTKLQKWFADQKITHLRQLSGYTCGARSVSDIKLVITESSLKYLKMYQGEGEGAERMKNALAAWADRLENGFGVVKTDKKTAHMYGKMVCTNYQMINTIPLDQKEVGELLAPSLSYLERILSDPVYMRHYIQCLLREEKQDEFAELPFLFDEDDTGLDESNEALLNYRKRMVLEMLTRNEGFAKTAFYSDFRKDMKKAFLKKLQMGRILVNGTYATLFGNGAELLHATTHKDYWQGAPYTVALEGAQIDSARFADGTELLGVRSPHVTMGNLYLATNKHQAVYRDYFNLTEEIVCVNAIENNIQHRLNGCDYDSDTMLLTDEPLLLRNVKEYYSEFAVPYCAVSPSGSADFDNTPSGLAALDIAIANNCIGQIINLSQYYNSLYWDALLREGVQDKPLYLTICKLAVMSGMEIDKAKRIYPLDSEVELLALSARRASYRAIGEEPRFYQFVTKQIIAKGEQPVLCCPMEYLFCHAKAYAKRAPRQLLQPLGSLLGEQEVTGGHNDSKYKSEILEIVRAAQRDLNRIQSRLHVRRAFRLKTGRSAAAAMEELADVIEKCIIDVNRKVKTPRVIRLLVKELDKPQNLAKSCRSLLLASLCFATTHNFYHMVEAARDHEMCDLAQDELGEELIYGIPHKRVVKRLAHRE